MDIRLGLETLNLAFLGRCRGYPDLFRYLTRSSWTSLIMEVTTREGNLLVRCLRCYIGSHVLEYEAHVS